MTLHDSGAQVDLKRLSTQELRARLERYRELLLLKDLEAQVSRLQREKLEIAAALSKLSADLKQHKRSASIRNIRNLVRKLEESADRSKRDQERLDRMASRIGHVEQFLFD